MTASQITVPPGLARVAGNRDFITLRELAQVLCKAEQTLRKLHCTQGEVYGIRLHKVGGRLLAPVTEAAELLNRSRK